ncbi:MAG: BlaI/MecI/CopY family transcriptional regulator [Planctomycetales bacterium]|nr:BlaI/MecI/CopY family transcriptional regulator [Planctomycetales bacterium]
MVRPKHEHPTPAELEVLQILWQHGPSTVRDVLDRLPKNRKRGYTTVMSLLNVMFDKKMLTRKPQGRAFLYAAKADQAGTLGKMIQDLLHRAFDGSSATLVAHLLDQAAPDANELAEIRRLLEQHETQPEDQQ